MSRFPQKTAVVRRMADLMLTVFAVALAVYAARFLGNQNFWLDEYYSIHLVDFAWGEIAEFASWDVHPPLYYYILKAFRSALGPAPIVYRIASYAAYLLTLGMALVLFRPAFGRLAAFLFLCLAGANVTMLRYCTEVRMYGWALFFVLLCAFAGYKLLAVPTPRRRWWAVWTAAGLAAAYTHYFALLAVGGLYLTFLIATLRTRRALLRGWGIATAVSVACYLPWVCLTAVHLTQQVSTFWLQQPPPVQETVELIAGGRLSSWVVLALAAAACLYAVWRPQRPCGAKRWLIASGLLVAVLLPLAGYVASELVRPMYLARYFLPAAGLLWLVMAVAVADLLRRAPCIAQAAGGLLAAALILYTLAGPSQAYLQEIQECNAVVDQALAYVQTRYQPGDKIYSTLGTVDQRVLDFLFPEADSAAGNDPAAALPQQGGSLFLIYAEDDPAGDWAAALESAGLQLDSWQGALLDNTWCRIYYYAPTGA